MYRITQNSKCFQCLGLERWLAVKNTICSSKGTKLANNLLDPIPGYPPPSPASVGFVLHVCTYKHGGKTLIYKIKIKKIGGCCQYHTLNLFFNTNVMHYREIQIIIKIFRKQERYCRNT